MAWLRSPQSLLNLKLRGHVTKCHQPHDSDFSDELVAHCTEFHWRVATASLKFQAGMQHSVWLSRSADLSYESMSIYTAG